MTPDEYNILPVDTKADMLWGTNGTGKFIETMSEYGKHKIGLYILDELMVSVYYDLTTNKIIDIKAWQKDIDRMKILENVLMN